jgi:integrase
MAPAKSDRGKSVCSLSFELWPAADRTAWEAACRPAVRLTRGGTASHLKPVTRNDLQRRYGYFLDFLSRWGRLDLNSEAAGQATPENVNSYIAELRDRVSSVTVHGSFSKLRQMIRIIAPGLDLKWLAEVEADLRYEMRPRSKFDRVVLTDNLVKAGQTLMTAAATTPEMKELPRARTFRNGLMMALLACCPIRLKNFAGLEIGRSIVEHKGRWWITLSAADTKEKRPDERPIPDFLQPAITAYVKLYRPILQGKNSTSLGLWLSSMNGAPMKYSAVEEVITETARSTVGVKVTPHLFRTSGSSSAAVYVPDLPHLGSALLHHIDQRVTEEHYNRASSVHAAEAFAALIDEFYRRAPDDPVSD